MLKILIAGDSNGVPNSPYVTGLEWPLHMKATLEARFPLQTFEVVNSSQGGWNLGYYLNGYAGHTLASLVTNHNPNVVIPALGTNDSYGTQTPPDPAEAVTTYQSRLVTFADTVEAHDNGDGTTPRVVFAQPPVAMDAVYGTRDGYTGYISNPYVPGVSPYTYGRPRATLIAIKDAVSTLAAERGRPCIPAWDNLAALLGWSGLTNVATTGILDGVHLTDPVPASYGVWAADAVSELLDADGFLLTDSTPTISTMKLRVDAEWRNVTTVKRRADGAWI